MDYCIYDSIVHHLCMYVCVDEEVELGWDWMGLDWIGWNIAAAAGQAGLEMEMDITG